MRKYLLVGLLTAGTPSFSSSTDVSSCIALDNDLDRLACYDTASGRSPKPSSVPTSSQWKISTETSEFKDTTDVFMHVVADEPVTCGFSGADHIRLYLRCVENTTALILATHCHVASGFHGYGEVEYRIDNQSTKKRTFNESTNNRSLGLWSGGKSIPVIKSLFGKNTLLVRFTPFNENPVTARFDISGIEEAIEPLRENCNW